jgi:hypothetical protein
MADTIFLVHGMGHHPDDWYVPVQKTLKQLYGKYNISRIPFDTRFTIQPISYDSVFRMLVARWQADATALGAASAAVGATEVGNLVGWLRNAGQVDNNFVWTHAADVLLYRLFYTVRHEVKTHVAAELARGIDALPASARWSVIAHSLGTAVAHDSLDMLMSGTQEDGSPTGFEARHEQALVVAQVANVSRVLQTAAKAYDSNVKPGRAGQNGRGCRKFLNFRHVLDPFTIPKMFRPDNWPDSTAVAKGLYRYIEVNHVHDINVHDLTHYLKHPDVHIPLFRSLAGFKSAVTKAQEEEALANFKQFGQLSQSAGISLKEKLEEVSPGISEDWKTYREIWDMFFGLFNT